MFGRGGLTAEILAISNLRAGTRQSGKSGAVNRHCGRNLDVSEEAVTMRNEAGYFLGRSFSPARTNGSSDSHSKVRRSPSRTGKCRWGFPSESVRLSLISLVLPACVPQPKRVPGMMFSFSVPILRNVTIRCLALFEPVAVSSCETDIISPLTAMGSSCGVLSVLITTKARKTARNNAWVFDISFHPNRLCYRC
jgi:hypothetical protein